MTVKMEERLQYGGAPEYVYHNGTAWRCAVFVGQGMAAKDIHKEMLPMYGEHCLSRQAVHNWMQKFSEGRTSIEDEQRVGQPLEIVTPATLQCVEDIIRADRRLTIDAVATDIGYSHGQAYNIFRGNASLTVKRLKERCARGSDSTQKNFTPHVSRDLRNGGTSV